MSISAKIQAIAEAVATERDNPNNGGISQTAQTLHGLATNAILGGSEDWVSYMEFISADPAELARLIPSEPDDTAHREERRTARAYLVANGMCTEATTGNLLMQVTQKLDV